jgi:hypothetical protein
MAWSMVLNLIIPPKYAKLEPKEGTSNHEALKAQQEDARPFVDKAKSRVNAFDVTI